MTFTLDNWEFEPDKTNNRIIIRSVDTGNEYYLNENGNIEVPTGGGADLDTLNGADLANALAGEVPKSDGDGTATMDAVTNENVEEFNTTGASGEVPKSDGTGGLSMGTVGGGGTKVIQALTFGGESSADFTTNFNNHRGHLFVLHNVVPSSDSEAWIRTSSDGGATWDSGTSDYVYAGERLASNSGEANFTSTGDTHIKITGADGVGSAAGEEGISGMLKIFGTGQAKRTQVTFQTSADDPYGDITHAVGSGARVASEAVTGVQFLFTSGNIESGTIEHIGIN